MDKRPDLKFQQVIEMIRGHFDFLFQRGYEIVSAMFTDPEDREWNVILAGEGALVEIRCRNERVSLTLSSEKLFEEVGMFDLRELVEFMRVEKNPHKKPGRKLPNESEQVRTTARLLEKNLEEILNLFRKIHSKVALNEAGELSNDSSPVLLFHPVGKAVYASPA